MPFPSGRCGFCDTHLRGQPTRGPHDVPLTCGDGSGRVPILLIPHDTDLKAA
jgi:hypothetical protein